MPHLPFSKRSSTKVSQPDDLVFSYSLGTFDAGPPIDVSSKGPHATDLRSGPLSPARWSRIKLSNNYAALGSSKDLSLDADTKKNVDSPSLISTQYDGFRTDTEILSPEAAPSITGEVPKEVIRRGIRGNWNKLWPHLAAICVTVAVVQLSFRNVYWQDLKPPDEQIAPGLTQSGALNFLQLAAKLHELLILGSLASIILHAVQAHLLGGSGLPLGMVANAFELGSGEYLRRKSFWSAWWTVDPESGRRFSYTRFWLLSLLSSVLVTLAGPSSAISVIPTLNYFDFPRPFDQPVQSYYVFNHSTELWPRSMTAATLNAPGSNISCLSATSDTEQAICPSGGFRETYDWAGSLLFTDTDRGTNISFPAFTGNAQRILRAQSCDSTADGRASAVTLNDFIFNSMTVYWTFAQQNFQGIALQAAQPRMNIDPETEIFGPRTEVLCSSYANYNYDPKKPEDQPAMTFPTFDGSGGIPVPAWTYGYSRPLNITNFTFVEMPPSSDPNAPSVGAVAILPDVAKINGTWRQVTENVACSIFSQWVPLDVWYEPTVSDQVSYSISTDFQDTCLQIPTDPSSRRQPINTTITTAYANAINQPIDFVTGNKPALLGILERFVLTDSRYIPDGQIFNNVIPGVAGIVVTEQVARKARAKSVSTVLAGVVTDGLARNAGDGQYPYAAPMFLLPNRTSDGILQGRFPVVSAAGGQDEPLNTTNAADTSHWLALNPTFQRYGYGYRFHGSGTTQFGIGVLLIHLGIAMAHLLFVLNEIVGRGHGIQRGWETVPEMLALALNSRPSARLRNTCAGITQGGTWREVIGVREAGEGHLEMVVGRHEVGGRPLARPRVTYGAVPAGVGREDWREFEAGVEEGIRRRLDRSRRISV